MRDCSLCLHVRPDKWYPRQWKYFWKELRKELLRRSSWLHARWTKWPLLTYSHFPYWRSSCVAGQLGDSPIGGIQVFPSDWSRRNFSSVALQISRQGGRWHTPQHSRQSVTGYGSFPHQIIQLIARQWYLPSSVEECPDHCVEEDTSSFIIIWLSTNSSAMFSFQGSGKIGIRSSRKLLDHSKYPGPLLGRFQEVS